MLKLNDKCKIICFYLVYGLIFLFFSNYRNNLYVPLYNAIYSKETLKFVHAIFFLIMISFGFFFIDFVSKFFKDLEAQKNRRIHDIFDNSFQDLSQILALDQKNIMINYCDIFIKLFPNVFLILWFTPKMFFIIGLDYTLIGFLSAYILFSIVFIGVLKHYYRIFFNNQLFMEESIQQYLHSWFCNTKVLPNIFDKIHYYDKVNSSFSTDLFIAFNNAIITCYQSISLVIPFIVFFVGLKYGKYDFGQYMQIINIWTSINYAVQGLFESYESFGLYQANNLRLSNAKKMAKTDKIYSEKGIEIENVKISFKKKCILHISKCIFFKNEIINLYGKNGSGKTSLIKSIIGIYPNCGMIKILKNYTYISETPTFPLHFRFKQTDKFMKYCAMFQVNPKLSFDTASGAEKWRLIAAYALSLNNYVIWDDPVWGNSDDLFINLFIKELSRNSLGGLISSSVPLNDDNFCKKINISKII